MLWAILGIRHRPRPRQIARIDAAPDDANHFDRQTCGAAIGNPSPTVREAFARTRAGDRPWVFLTDLATIGGRVIGGPGNRRTSTLIADAFTNAGVRRIESDPFEVARRTRDDTTFDLIASDERRLEAVTLPYAPLATASGLLVDIGYGTLSETDIADVDGVSVVASTTTPTGGWPAHQMEKFNYVVGVGAVGFVFVNHAPGQLPLAGVFHYDEEAAAPAVGVGAEAGSRLTNYAAYGGEAILTVGVETTPGENRNVGDRVDPDTGRGLPLCAHFDTHDITGGVLDSGCDIAVAVIMVRLLVEVDLALGTYAAGVGAGGPGLTGSEHLVGRLDLDRIAAVANVDGAGRSRDLVAHSHISEAAAVVTTRVGNETCHPVNIKLEPHPFSDQWPLVRASAPAL